MELFIDGTVLFINPKKEVKDKFFTQEFGIDTSVNINGTIYESYCGLQAVNDKCSMLDDLNVGHKVRCHYSIRGTKKVKDGLAPTEKNKEGLQVFTNLGCWKIERLDANGNVTTDAPPAPTASSSVNTPPPPAASTENKDDLPF